MPGTPFTEFGATSYALELFPSFTSVITPVPFNAQNAAATQSQTLGVVASGVASGVTAGTATPTASAGRASTGSASTGAASAGSTGSNTGPATPSKTSGASVTELPSAILSCAIVAVVFCNLVPL
jgi:hypothetical protein